MKMPSYFLLEHFFLLTRYSEQNVLQTTHESGLRFCLQKLPDSEPADISKAASRPALKRTATRRASAGGLVKREASTSRWAASREKQTPAHAQLPVVRSGTHRISRHVVFPSDLTCKKVDAAPCESCQNFVCDAQPASGWCD